MFVINDYRFQSKTTSNTKSKVLTPNIENYSITNNQPQMLNNSTSFICPPNNNQEINPKIRKNDNS